MLRRNDKYTVQTQFHALVWIPKESGLNLSFSPRQILFVKQIESRENSKLRNLTMTHPDHQDRKSVV